MATFQKKSFTSPDEKLMPPHATVETVSIDGMSVRGNPCSYEEDNSAIRAE